MSKKITDLLQKKRKVIDDFLIGVRKVNEIVPVVKEAKEETEWALDVFNKIPKEVSKKLDNKKLEGVYEEDFKIWDKALPAIKINPMYVTTSGSGASGTASNIVFSELLELNDMSYGSQRPMVQQWIRPHLDDYMKMQSHRNKAHDIEDVLRKIYSPLANEFADANSAYIKADTEILSPKDAANPMRNVLTHLEGNLVEMARVHPGENIPNGDSWVFIANRLATGGKGSSEHTLLSIKAFDQKSISVELTAITKNTAINPLYRLRMVYVQWLEHLNNTLKLINLSKHKT